MSELPPEISIIETPDGGVRYCLPKRPPDTIVRIVVGVIMSFGACIAGAPILFILFELTTQQAGQKSGMLQPGVLFPLLVFGPICFPLGGLIIFWGLHIVAGRTEVAIRSGRLRVLYKWGPFGFPRRMQLNKLRIFRLSGDMENTQFDAMTREDETSNLIVELSSGKLRAICVNYPRKWLLPLAEDLARRCQQLVEHQASQGVEPIVVEAEAGTMHDRTRQPSNSSAILERKPNEITIRIPAPGMLKGSSRFFVQWCVGWNIMVLLTAPIFLYSAFQGGMKWEGTDENVSFPFMCCFTTPFILIGIGSLMGLYIRGQRSVVISAAENSLEVIETGFSGTRPSIWQTKHLIAISAIREKQDDGEGGVSWMISLGIQTTHGSITRHLSYRDQAELEWIATLLRQTLQIAKIESSRINP